MQSGDSPGELLASAPFANLLDVCDGIAITDANVFAHLGYRIEAILVVNHCGLRGDLLDEVLHRFRENSSSIIAAISERLVDPCSWAKLLQSPLNLARQFCSAQELPHVGSRHLVTD